MKVKGGFETDQKVQVVDGVPVPEEIHIDATDESWPFDVRMIVRLAKDRMKIRSVEFNVHDGADLASADLKIPMLIILRTGVAHALGRLSYLAGRDAQKMREQGPTEESLRLVAAAYRLAMLAGHAPTKAVAVALDMPRPTAARWVEKARDQGFLGKATERQAGEKKPRKVAKPR